MGGPSVIDRMTGLPLSDQSTSPMPMCKPPRADQQEVQAALLPAIAANTRLAPHCRKDMDMSMEYIRKAYGVPAKRGGRITYHDRGTGKALRCIIVAARGHYLRVRKDGAHRRCILTLHPTWHVEYDDA